MQINSIIDYMKTKWKKIIFNKWKYMTEKKDIENKLKVYTLKKQYLLKWVKLKNEKKIFIELVKHRKKLLTIEFVNKFNSIIFNNIIKIFAKEFISKLKKIKHNIKHKKRVSNRYIYTKRQRRKILKRKAIIEKNKLLLKSSLNKWLNKALELKRKEDYKNIIINLKKENIENRNKKLCNDNNILFNKLIYANLNLLISIYKNYRITIYKKYFNKWKEILKKNYTIDKKKKCLIREASKYMKKKIGAFKVFNDNSNNSTETNSYKDKIFIKKKTKLNLYKDKYDEFKKYFNQNNFNKKTDNFSNKNLVKKGNILKPKNKIYNPSLNINNTYKPKKIPYMNMNYLKKIKSSITDAENNTNNKNLYLPKYNNKNIKTDIDSDSSNNNNKDKNTNLLSPIYSYHKNLADYMIIRNKEHQIVFPSNKYFYNNTNNVVKPCQIKNSKIMNNKIIENGNVYLVENDEKNIQNKIKDYNINPIYERMRQNKIHNKNFTQNISYFSS